MRMTTWWVGFGDAPTRSMGWWHRGFTHPGFRHCLAWRQHDADSVLVVHPRSDGLEIGISQFAPDRYAALAFRHLSLSGVVRLPRPPPRGVPVFRAFATCTEIVKAALAIDDWRVQTPRGLFRHLLRQPGAIFIHHPPPQEDTRWEA